MENNEKPVAEERQRKLGNFAHYNQVLYSVYLAINNKSQGVRKKSGRGVRIILAAKSGSAAPRLARFGSVRSGVTWQLARAACLLLLAENPLLSKRRPLPLKLPADESTRPHSEPTCPLPANMAKAFPSQLIKSYTAGNNGTCLVNLEHFLLAFHL